MDLSKILSLIYRYLWLLVGAALVAGIITFYQIDRQPPVYQATTHLLIGPGLDSPSPDLNSLKIGGQLGQTYAEVLSTASFLEAVNNKLSQKVDLTQLEDAISSRQSIETRLLTIIVEHPDPEQAVAIANAAAQTLLEMSPSKDNTFTTLRIQMSEQVSQLQQVVNESQARIKELESQLATLKDAQSALIVNDDPNLEAAKFNLDQQNLIVRELGEERSRLSETIRTMAAIYQSLLDTNTNEIEIIQPATIATQIDKQLWLRVISSVIAGLIFALIITFMAEYFDDRLRLPGDLSRAVGVPLLSVIDKHTSKEGTGLEGLVTYAQPNSDVANRYREGIAKLLFMIGESFPYTLLVSSLGSKNGGEADAAVAAGNLAVAFAQAGYKVALVDAQADHPALTALFKAEKKREELTNPMVTGSTVPQLLSIQQVPGIRLLPAGSSTEKNSRAMLNPANVAALFDRLQKEADIVLVAGSAISHFAENLLLASQVDSVVLVARQATLRSKEVSAVVENLRLMKINIAGVIFDYNSTPLISTEDGGIGSRRDNTPREAPPQGPLSEQTKR
jgi:capsular polysaccharide biosynthesis protein